MEFWLKMDKVMEFLNWSKKSWNFTNKFLMLMNRRHYAAASQNPNVVYVD